MEREEHTTLYFREGSSDKVYQAHLVQDGAGWSVNFEYGRRGGPLKAGTKTSRPLPRGEAKRVFDGLVREKTAKGYSPGEDGVRFAGTELAGRKTDHQPQLLNPVEDPEGYLSDAAFWAQEKFDGQRILIEKRGVTVTGINRRGLATGLPEPLVNVIGGCPGDFVVDGELVGATYHAFDILGDGPYSARLERLRETLGTHVTTARTLTEKQQLLADVKARGGEGIVLKRHDAPYTPGRPASGGSQLKHKFTQSASCIVHGANGGKRSVELGLFEAGAIRMVGNVTIPANHKVPASGAVVEVRYLYAFPGGSLFQPVYLGPRDDITPEDCLASQLKMKAPEDE